MERIENKSRVAEFGDRQALAGPSARPLGSSKPLFWREVQQRMDGRHEEIGFGSSCEEFFKSLEIDCTS